MLPALPRADARALAHDPEPARRRLHAFVEAALARAGAEDFAPTMTPDGYERACAEALRRAGWQAAATPPGADQGADVIAERAGRRLVLQCKWVSRPVGNRAVQEVAAARALLRATDAAVVSNQPYTPAARMLAEGNGIRLLHHTDLAALAATLAPASPASLSGKRRKDGRAA